MPHSLTSRRGSLPERARSLDFLPAILWAVLVAVAFQTAFAAAEGGGAARIAKSADVVREWRPSQHLYVKGDLGVSQSQLDNLEQWLDANATNWVVVLLESAQGETFTDAEGKTFAGVEAVNHALGKGLMNQTALGQQVDSRTGEPNTAIFVLALKDRRLSYFASEAQDKRGLGEDHWIGNLDGPAKAAMRDGGRVVDAVKGTISGIDRQLASRITAEISARERQAVTEREARKQQIERADAAIREAGALVNMVESRAADFNRKRPGLAGNLARPDLPRLRAELKIAQSQLDNGEPQKVASSAAGIGTQAETLLRLLADYETDRPRFDALARRLKQQAAHPHLRGVRPRLNSAQAAFDQAQAAYLRGDSTYASDLAIAIHAADANEVLLAAATRDAAQRRLLAILGGITLLTGLGLGGALLNRRRLGPKRESEALFTAWEKGLGEKNVALFDLLDRRSSLVGDSAEEAARRYSGETLQLGSQVIQDVDEVFIMSSCTGRVLQDAESLLQPRVVWAKLVNLFFAQRYLQALRLLRDHPIEFRPGDALELVVRGPRTEKDRLLGNLASYQPFTMTFNELIDAFNQRAGRALAALDTIESNLIAVGSTLEGVQKTIDAARATEAGLLAATAPDGLFRVTAVFNRLLPAAQAALSEAIKTSLTDPVGSLRAQGALARRQAEDANALVTITVEFRQTGLPQLRQSAQALASSGLGTGWIDAELRRQSDAASQLAGQAVEESVARAIQTLKDELGSLVSRAAQAVSLDAARRSVSMRQIDDTTVLIESARQEIGTALGLVPDGVLREAGADPSDLLRRAIEQAMTASAALERGDTDAARNALDAVTEFTKQTAAIVAATRQAFSEQASASAELIRETERITSLLPEHQSVLSAIQARYAPAVLLLGAGDASHPNANGTIEDNLDEARAHLEAARERLRASAKSFQEGGVLEAATLLRQVRGLHEASLFRLAEIKEKERRLADAEAANARSLTELGARFAECERLASDPTTMMPTLRLFEDATAALKTASASVHDSPGDPLLASSQLAAAGDALAGVADNARCDRDVYNQAALNVKAAASQLSQARRLANQSAGDALPDSPAILAARAAVESLGMALASAEKRLAQSHEDWAALDQEADRIASQAGAQAATLQGELAKAQGAIAALSSAAAAVRLAGAWTGGFGVAIFGAPGSDLLSGARSLLQSGAYDEARRAAENACRMAELAVAQAQAEVLRRRRAEEERIERERRRREAEEEERRRRSSDSGGGGFGSGSSWGGSGAGMSGSSFSSGSGFSSSSW